MTPAPAYTSKFLRRRKSLLILPILVTPFIFLLFYSLGGGGTKSLLPAAGGIIGFNPELPKPLFRREKTEPDKLELYKKADADSLKRKEVLQQDPYHFRSSDNTRHGSPNTGALPAEDPKAGELLRRLDQLRVSMQQSAPYTGNQPSTFLSSSNPSRISNPPPSPYPAKQDPKKTKTSDPGRLQQALQSIRSADTSDEDPQLQKLNTMLDKIIRIQHPGEETAAGTAATGAAAAGTTGVPDPAGTSPGIAQTDFPDPVRSAGGAAGLSPGTAQTAAGARPVGPAAANTIPAAIPEDQTLVAGATIALRLTEAVRIGGVGIPKDQLIYGVVSIGNDRMLIHIRSIRCDRSIYPADLQVYDMDGLPGIHIPGTLGREVAKQSADQGIGSINPATFDPSLGAQAANAGIQTARALLSRKVKLVRVFVRAGYQVLLYPTKAVSLSNPATRRPEGPRNSPVGPSDEKEDHPDTTALISPPPSPSPITPPTNPPLTAFLHHTATAGKLNLTLQGIYLRQNILWFSLLLYNDGPIDYTPDYARWFTRDRHRVKRAAIQGLPLTPICTVPPPAIPGHSNRSLTIGFQPFVLARDKELVLQIGEANGARVLTMTIDPKELLKTKTR